MPVKYTYDVSQLKFDSSTKRPILEACPRGLGDADKCAIEEAVKIKERLGAETHAVSIIHDKPAIRALRDAIAMGINYGYAIYHKEAEHLDSIFIAKILYRFVKKTGPYDLIIMGAVSGDTHGGIVGPALSTLLNIPIIPYTDYLEVNMNNVVAKCLFRDGIYTFSLKAPAVITVSTEINEPRIPTLRDILRSKKVEIKKYDVRDLLPEVETKLEVEDIVKYEVPRKREIIDATDPDGINKSIGKIVEILKNEGLI